MSKPPPGYWTQVGVALNVVIALIGLVLVAHFRAGDLSTV